VAALCAGAAACVAGHNNGEDMRVFVAGATGAVGSRLIPLLVSAGHSVLGLTRTPGKAETIRRAGADVAVVDALDGVAVRQAVISAKPDVIVHEMTALSGVSDLRRFDRVFALTNRLRTEGLDHLLVAAKQAGTRRVVVQSFGGWPFARTGGPVKTEQDPLDPDPPKQLRRTLDAIRYLESKTTGAFEGEGLVLRYGTFYGPGTGMLDRLVIDQLRRRRVPSPSSVAHPESTISWMTSPLRSATGCRHSRPWWARSRPCACRNGWAG
jgi:2-alkyl-3-oxoalkanoate reductase